jgi:uncharacterized cupin superfamily protein
MTLTNRRKIAKPARIALLIAWSLFMLVLGNNVDSDFVVNKSFAVSDQSPELVPLDKLQLAGENLGEFSAYLPDRGDLVARGDDFYYSQDENLGIGVWESKPGSMTYEDLKYDELMLVLEGQLIMTAAEGKPQYFNQGEGFILPMGWSGTLAVGEEGVRKIWVSYMGSIKGS